MRQLLRARPHLLAAGLCLGLAAANILRDSSMAIALGAVVVAIAAVGAPPRWRMPALGVALALAGWWWGSARLDALDRSPLLRARGNGRPGPGCRHRSRAPLPVRPPCPCSDAALRRRRDPRAGPAPAVARPLAAARRSPRADRRDSPPARAERRLRRAYVAPSPRRPCRRPRIALAHRRAPRRALGLRRRASRPPGPLDGAGARRRAARGHRRDRARGRRGVIGEPAGTVSGLGPLPPARCVGPERRAHRRWRAPVRVPDRRLAGAGRDPRSGRDRRLRAGRRLAALGRPSGDRRRARLARLARSAASRPLVLPAPRRGCAARVEPVLAPRRGLPALLRRCRGDLRRRPASRALPRRLSVAPPTGRSRRRLGGLRSRDRPDPAHPVRDGAALFDPGKCARLPGRRSAAGDRPRDGAHRTGSAATCRRSRLGQRLAGGIPRRLRASRRRPSVRGCIRSSRAGCRGHRSRRCLAHRAAAPASSASRRGADSARSTCRRRLAPSRRLLVLASSTWPPHHVSRCRPRRRSAPSGARRSRADRRRAA